jgi:chaperonin GroES
MLLLLLVNSGKFDGTVLEYNGEDCQIIRDDNILLMYEGVTLRYENAIPVRDYVLVELPETAAQAKTESGIMLAAKVTRDLLPCEGIVVKVGEGRMSASGELTKSPVQVGDRVKFKDYSGNDILIEGKKYSVVKMVDILATYVGEKK